jgi:DNA-binding response OmpR family regulator
MDHPSSNRILVVADDAALRFTRVALLEKVGFKVASVSTDDDAMKALETEQFDLVLIGTSDEPGDNLAQLLREKYPVLLILKIGLSGEFAGSHSSRTTDSAPEHVVRTLKEMLN